MIAMFSVSMTIIPAIMFVPGAMPLRLFVKAANYLVCVLPWLITSGGRGRLEGAESFPPRPWLLGCVAWVLLSVLHPNTNSLLSGAAHATLYIAAVAPAFWGPPALRSIRQFPRLLAILFLCNSLSAVVGIAQVYYPGRFDPPVIHGLDDDFRRAVFTYKSDEGETIVRPCGLTDSPGAACMAGAAAGLLGLGWALRPIGTSRRIACCALALSGVTAIYCTHVRQALVRLVICLVCLAAILARKRDFSKATLLVLGSGSILAIALAWAGSAGGASIPQRFTTLLADDPGQLYKSSRGFFVEDTFNRLIWDYPLGAGMGRWGQAYEYLGDHEYPKIWVEVQIPGWVVDGGIPLLVLYVGAIASAIANAYRIALSCRDQEISYWAAVVCASGIGTLASCFSYVPFVTPVGAEFWLLNAALHAASLRANARIRRQRVLSLLRKNLGGPNRLPS